MLIRVQGVEKKSTFGEKHLLNKCHIEQSSPVTGPAWDGTTKTSTEVDQTETNKYDISLICGY